MDQKAKDEILITLSSKGVNHPCPRCGNGVFTLVDGYFNEMIQPNANTLNIGGHTIPTVLTVCNRCGYLSQHALGVLGLLPKTNENIDKKTEDKNEK